jgi:2-polyprenyl-3-methyl-5-hydroxy-6-metoxy-1,4-benzoquinol methylase
MTRWIEPFFGGLYGTVLSHQFDERESEEQARVAKRLLKLRKGMRVLDLPCGMGRLTIPLARMGITMTGVDLMDSYIRRARRRAKQAGVTVDFRQGDMRNIEFDSTFHAVVNWFSSFGYFSDAENLQACRRMFQALKPGGRLVIECLNKSWLLANLEPHLTMNVHGVKIDIHSRFNARSQRATGTWVMRKGTTTERCHMSLRMYNGTDIRHVLHQAGFREIVLYGRPPLARLTRHARRFVAVGRRPTSRA